LPAVSPAIQDAFDLTLVQVTAVFTAFALGTVLTLALQGAALEPVTGGSPSHPVRTLATVPEPPDTFLVWTSGGLPDGFGAGLARLPNIGRSVVVESDNTWMTQSYDARGDLVDHPPNGYAIPLEVGAVEPRAYAPFLPPADRGDVVALARGEGILGASSARLRGLGPGAVLVFGNVRIRIAAVLPDELVGAQELFVSRATGRTIGVTHDRYALLQPDGQPTDGRLERELRRIVPADIPMRVRAPGETPYFRQGDAVLPPVIIKQLFGEFAARPYPGRPGYLQIDPAWVRTHIATERVPILGRATCNVALFPQLRGAMRTLVARGLADTIQSFSGCYAARYTNRDPTSSISHHAWGIAFDVNVPQNPFGATPHQDPRLVRVMERWGFIWGGTFIRPDGMHFEYHRPPPST
jgi:hypothetical protein